MSDSNILNIDDPTISFEETTEDLRVALNQRTRYTTASQAEDVILEPPSSPIDFFAIHNRSPKTDLKVRVQAVIANIRQPLPINKRYEVCEIVEFQLATKSVHEAMSVPFLNKVSTIAIRMLELVSPVIHVKEDDKQPYFMAKTQVLTKNDWVTIKDDIEVPTPKCVYEGKQLHIQFYVFVGLTIMPQELPQASEQPPAPKPTPIFDVGTQMEVLHKTKDDLTPFQIMEQLGQMFHNFGLAQLRKQPPTKEATPTPTPARKRHPDQEDREFRHKRHSENRRDR